MKVKECMCENVCYCTPDTKIADAAKMMNTNGVGCIPICDDKKCVVGILTDRDIILRSVACDKDTSNTKVSEIMTCNTVCCDCNEEVNTVVDDMGKTGVRRIPVTENGKLVGILTMGDLAKHQNISCECVGTTFENICNCENKNNK